MYFVAFITIPLFGQLVFELPCSAIHRFHSVCSEEWLTDHANCPCCRANIDTDALQPFILLFLGVSQTQSITLFAMFFRRALYMSGAPLSKPSRYSEDNKIDMSFYLGYESYKRQLLRPVLVHIIQFMTLAVFLPIDITLLSTDSLIVIAIGVAMVTTAFCFSFKMYVYFKFFIEPQVGDVRKLAKDIGYLTDQPVEIGSSLEDSVSCIWFDCGCPLCHPSFWRNRLNKENQLPNATIRQKMRILTIEHYSQSRIEASTEWVRQKIQNYLQGKHIEKQCCSYLSHLVGLTSILLVVVAMAITEQLHPAEIVILVGFCILQLYLDIYMFIVVLILIILLVLCIFVAPVSMIRDCCQDRCCAQPNRPGRQEVVRQDASGEDAAVKCASVQQMVASSQDCAICLTEVEAGSKVYPLPCSQKHVFHAVCLKSWMKFNLKCPICRAQLPLKLVKGKGQSMVLRVR